MYAEAEWSKIKKKTSGFKTCFSCLLVAFSHGQPLVILCSVQHSARFCFLDNLQLIRSAIIIYKFYSRNYNDHPKIQLHTMFFPIPVQFSGPFYLTFLYQYFLLSFQSSASFIRIFWPLGPKSAMGISTTVQDWS